MEANNTSQQISTNNGEAGEAKLTLDSIFNDAATEELAPPAQKTDEKKDAVEDNDGQEDEGPDKQEAGEDTEGDGEDAHEAESTEETDKEQEGEKKPDGKRDYSKFDKEDQPFLKQMSRPAFEHFSKRLTAVKDEIVARDQKITEMQKVVDEAQGKRLPDAWYNDPEAGKVSPAYKEAAKLYNDSQAKVYQLTEILDGVEAGDLVYDGKNFVPRAEGDEKPVDRRVVRYLMDERQKFFDEAKVHADKANAIEREFATNYKHAEAYTNAATEKFFPWVKDEKHVNQGNLKAIMNEWAEPYRRHPVARFASALAVQHLILQRKYADQTKELAAAKNLKKARQPDPKRGRANGPVSEEDKPLKISDFES